MRRVRHILAAIGADGQVALAVLVAASLAGWAYLTAFGIVTGPEHNVSDMLRPAVFIATGYGFCDCRPLPPAVEDFLNHRSPRLDPGVIQPDPRIARVRGTFYQDRYYLIRAVGLLWRIFGISWKTVNILSAFFFGATAALLYGIFRFGMGRTLSLTGVALTMLSPVMLMQVPSIRDFTKAPFILATIFLCGYLLLRRMARKRFYAVAVAGGFVIGAGLGFRQDVIICLPLVLLFLVFFARGEPRLAVRTRLGGALLLLVCFLPPAWPALSITAETGGNNSFYLTQGFSLPCVKEVDVLRSSYTPLYTNSDYIVQAYIYTFAKTQLPYYKNLHNWQVLAMTSGIGEALATPASPTVALGPLSMFAAFGDRLDTWTPPAEQAARRYVYELATTFPGDVIAKWYAAALRVIRNLQPIAYFYRPPDPMLAKVTALEAPLARHCYHYGLFYALAAFLIISAHSFRLATGVLFILVYSCGYPSLEFQVRHAFHLNFAAFWFPCFVLDKIVVAAKPRRLIAALKRPWLRPAFAPMGRMALFAVFAAALFCVPLYVARAFQEKNVTRLLARYQEAELEPLEVTEQTDSDGRTIYCPGRFPSFEWIPPVKLLNVLALTGLPVKRVPDILVEYVVAEFETTTQSPDVDIRYKDPGPYFDQWEPYPLTNEPVPCTFRFFFPVFYFTDNFRLPYGAGVTTFKGLAFPDSVNLTAFYRVRNKHDFTFLMNVWLPSDPALFRKCQRVKLLTW